EQQQAAKDEVDQAATDAIRDINAATDNNGINTAKASGLTGIELAQTKADAIEAVEAEKAKAHQDIDNKPGLSGRQKADAKAKVDAAATEAENNINAAADTEAIRQPKENGKTKVELEKEKADAISKIEVEKQASHEAIEADNNLDRDQKDAAKDKITKAAKEAEDNINAAPDKDGITQPKENGLEKVKLEKAKADAISEVEAEKAKAHQDIDNKPGLSDKQKADAKAKVDAAAKEAEANINGAADTDAIRQPKENGLEKVKLEKAKADAISEVEAEKAKAHQDIDNKPGLSDKQKADAKAKVDAAAKEAEANINAAADTEAINAAKATGTSKIVAIEALAEKQNQVNKVVDSNNNLDDNQKATIKAKVAEATAAAMDAVNDAANTNEINAAKNLGENKADALKDLVDKQGQANAEIDANTNVSQADRNKAKAKVAEATAAAMDSVNDAANTNEINAAKNLGENKADALKDLVDKQGQANKAIDGSQHVDGADKNLAKQAIAAATTAAMDAVNAATNTNEINVAKATGTSKIAAIEALAEKQNEVNKAVDGNGLLNADQKDLIKTKVFAAVSYAMSDINKVDEIEEIEKSKTAGMSKVELEKAKADAISEIEAEKAKAHQDIDKNTSLTPDQKDAAKDKITKAAKEAEDSINGAASIEEVRAELNKAKEKVELAKKEEEAKAAGENVAKAINKAGLLGNAGLGEPEFNIGAAAQPEEEANNLELKPENNNANQANAQEIKEG
ncbi:DUF1542 domain-containing protein, partial [Gemella sp. zg-1178]|uniref:DUF1542 domain-containing protein n=1 Tax=Gemella sp. zg-1178 TaxID=2840372 RepID=UPI001C04BF5F